MFTIYILTPHLHDTVDWTPSSYKARTYIFYMVNIMGADVLATQAARVLATMIFTRLNLNNSVPHVKG